MENHAHHTHCAKRVYRRCTHFDIIFILILTCPSTLCLQQYNNQVSCNNCRSFCMSVIYIFELATSGSSRACRSRRKRAIKYLVIKKENGAWANHNLYSSLYFCAQFLVKKEANVHLMTRSLSHASTIWPSRDVINIHEE